jgi:hypothetical protein
MCASNLIDNYDFIKNLKNLTKYLIVFVPKSVKKTKIFKYFLTKKNRRSSGAQNPKTRLYVSILIIQTHIRIVLNLLLKTVNILIIIH